MKKFIYILWMVAFMMGFASCESDNIETKEVASTEKAITINAVLESGPLTRAMVELGNQDDEEYFQWNEGDFFWFDNLGPDGDEMYYGGGGSFSISGYSDDNPSNSASFVCGWVNGVGISDGDVMSALFSGNSKGTSNNFLSLSVETEYSMGTNSKDYIKNYMYDNLFMFAKNTYYESGTTLSFKQLTSMARITYVNGTDEDQSISSVSISSDLPYFGTNVGYNAIEEYYEIWGTAQEISQSFDGLTVAAKDSVDFYLLFFQSDTEFSSEAPVQININDYTVEIDATNLYSTVFEPAYRYWFGVTQTSDGLYWTNSVPSESNDVTTEEDSTDEGTSEEGSSDETEGEE